MDDRLKVLPLVAIAGGMLCLVKLVNIGEGIGQNLLVAPAQAADAPQKETKADYPPDEKTKDEETGGEAADEADSAGVSFSRAEFTDGRDPALLSESEVRVLQNLADRRTLLEQREQELSLKENLLAATEKRIEERIDELKALETRIEGLLIQKDEEDAAQITSLVKVYETMKAKDAARIFENLDQDILLAVSARMREAKVAAILAQMKPETAQRLTVMLARPIAGPGAGQ